MEVNPEIDSKKEFKKVIRDVKIPEQITIQELSNRMAEKSNDIIKFLFNMKVVATINHNIDKDTAEYIVKEFGHKPILEEKPSIGTGKSKEIFEGEVKNRPPVIRIINGVSNEATFHPRRLITLHPIVNVINVTTPVEAENLPIKVE